MIISFSTRIHAASGAVVLGSFRRRSISLIASSSSPAALSIAISSGRPMLR